MQKPEWLKKIDAFISEIENDKELNDDDFSEVMGELSDRATTSYNAKSDEDYDEGDEEVLE